MESQPGLRHLWEGQGSEGEATLSLCLMDPTLATKPQQDTEGPQGLVVFPSLSNEHISCPQCHHSRDQGGSQGDR